MRVSSDRPEERGMAGIGRSLMSRIFPAPKMQQMSGRGSGCRASSSQDWKVTFSDYFWTFSAGRTRHFWRGGSFAMMDESVDFSRFFLL
ncbi:hypothetical protein CEXT_458551 [Caerostris extrusa]|uniref:Uncharacterized protein n=1 Tax=Caerostris extrusa TaxID=172846 RepID=A0AAV4NY87_CAEEX|nr:hypothetical protein CEXT_458551 [Caerostris extrusa]